MPALIMDPTQDVPEEPENLGFVVSHQKVELEVDFVNQRVSGRTEITAIPQTRDLKVLKFHARQCEIPKNGVTINGKIAGVQYEDGYKRLEIPDHVKWSVEQHDLQRDKISSLLETQLTNGELEVSLPRSVHIQDVDPFSDGASNGVLQKTATGGVRSSLSANGTASTPTLTARPTEGFAPLTVVISFSIESFRDGLRFVGMEDGDLRYPHVYTRHSINPGIACCIFPCVDDPTMRCTWEMAIKCSRTLGDALKRPVPVSPKLNGVNGALPPRTILVDDPDLSDDDRLLEMSVVCSGELTDEIIDRVDKTKKVVSFLCSNPVAAQHIGFAIGPFEQVNLSEYREADEDDKLGQKAVQVTGYCLPGRSEELRNTCATTAQAIDYFSLTFGSYPFTSYTVCFVDDQIPDTVHTASLSLCSTRLLFPEELLDPLVEVTRKLVHALASQWIGISIVAAQPADTWAIVGISHFITEIFMKKLCGNNEYRFRQKTLQDRLVELDVDRPSLYALGETLHLGSFELEFMTLKSPLVLFILDRRLFKASGSTGLPRIISRLFTNANVGDANDRLISTEGFRRLCEKVGHLKLDTFFNQWIMGAGCPRFHITQKFNKKRLCVDMTISQKQSAAPAETKLKKQDFLREFKEENGAIYAGVLQTLFTGPMTIRIHEADGTPYEHIVEIKEPVQRIEIPYNTKYKRLKRSRRQMERANAASGADINADGQDDVLLYCLGDVLQSAQEIGEWQLSDWDAETIAKMDAESFEWIRMDADFEWLCRMDFPMPPYMYVSQLQQDRDVVAQQDSMLFLKHSAPVHPLVSAILVRTLVDRRYFHGIRTMAAEALAKQAASVASLDNAISPGMYHLEKAFQEFFCYPGSQTPRSNDFSDRSAYLIQCAIPQAMAKIRLPNGRCPAKARQFILDQLRFNDNGNNEFSDHYYVAGLMEALAESLIPRRNIQAGEMEMDLDDDDEAAYEMRQFQQKAIAEIERYRRMDQWILSYQNVFTTTALKCKHMLMKAHVIPYDPREFIQYVNDGTLDLVRIKAFDAVMDFDSISNESILRFFLHNLSTDPSPYVRDQLHQIFGVALAAVAFGEHKPEEKATEVDGLVIEAEGSVEARKAHIARTTTILGAIAALKSELKDNVAMKEGLWGAVRSKELGLSEQSDILEICNILYDPVDSMVVVLTYPRYWKVKYLGRGKLRFKRKRKVRTKPMKKLEFPKPAVPKPAVPPSPQKSRPTSPTLVRKPTSTILKLPIKPGFTPKSTPPPIKRENSVSSSTSAHTPSSLSMNKHKENREGSVASQSSSSKPMAPPQPKPLSFNKLSQSKPSQPKPSQPKPSQPKLSQPKPSQSKPSQPKPMYSKPYSNSSSSSSRPLSQTPRPSSQVPRPLSQTPRPRSETKIIKLKTGSKARKVEQIMNSERKKLPSPKPLPSRAQSSSSPVPSSLNRSFTPGSRPSPGPAASSSMYKSSSSALSLGAGASSSVSTKPSAAQSGSDGPPPLKKSGSLKLKFTKRVPEQ